MNPKLEVGLSGRFLLEAVNAETGERRFLAEFDNLITDAGMNKLGSAGATKVISHVQVGTGSTAPATTDTSLASYLDGTDRSFAISSTYGGSPTYHTETVYSWEFDQGAAAGNLSEIGVGWAVSGSLFSRALIVDGAGSPTTVTVTSIEFLAVTYKLRMYPPTTDVTGSISMGGVSYDYIIRPSGAGGGGWQRHGDYGYASINSVVKFGQAYNGNIGPITGSPSGTVAASTWFTSAAYVNNSYKLTMTSSMGISEGNLVGGIRTIVVPLVSASGYARQMSWQCQFDPAIPKDNTKTLSLTFEVAWARKP